MAVTVVSVQHNGGFLPGIQPSIVEKVQQRRKAPPPPPGARSQIGEPISLEAEPTYAEMLQAVRAMAN